MLGIKLRNAALNIVDQGLYLELTRMHSHCYVVEALGGAPLLVWLEADRISPEAFELCRFGHELDGADLERFKVGHTPERGDFREKILLDIRAIGITLPEICQKIDTWERAMDRLAIHSFDSKPRRCSIHAPRTTGTGRHTSLRPNRLLRSLQNTAATLG